MERKERKNCIVCGAVGSDLYSSLVDVLFGAKGEWNVLKCDKCSLLWLSPYAVGESVASLYSNYYTHEGLNNEFLETLSFSDFPLNKKIKYSILSASFKYEINIPKKYRAIGKFLSVFPSLRRQVKITSGGFEGFKKGKLLDIGCGNGDYLLEMRYLGHEVYGTEIDKKSVQIARKHGLNVLEGALVDGLFSKNSFDSIHLNNVIEHLPDPEKTISICFDLLKDDGELCIKTCSSQSLAHYIYKKSYRGLEIPRHFFIFSPQALETLGKKVGFAIKDSFTSFNGYIWLSSSDIKNGKKDPAYVVGGKIKIRILKFFIEKIYFLFPSLGDDIFLLLKK